MGNLRNLSKQLEKDYKKLQEDLEFFTILRETKTLEEEDKKKIKKSIKEIRNDLNILRCEVDDTIII